MLGAGSRHIKSAMSAWQQVSSGVRPQWDGARQLSKEHGLTLTVPTGGKLGRVQALLEINYDLAWTEMALCVELDGRPWQDTDTTDARLACEENGIKQIAKGDVEDMAVMVAQQNAYHPVKRYLGGLKWDGRARLDTLWVRYFGAADTALTRALGACFGIGAVKRVLEPGSKVDMMPILYGPQGALKSTALRTLAGDAFFTDARPNFGHRAENALTLSKCWIWELAELEGMDRSEQREIKAFVTRAEDDVLLPYARAKTTLRRHAVMLGTTNEEHCLRDATGSRRHPVITIGKIDVKALRRDRDLLWAEAKARALAGEQHWLADDLTETLQASNDEHEAVHAGFEAKAVEWATMPPKGRISFGLADFLSEGCHIPISGQTKSVQVQAGQALRLAGFVAKRGPKPRKLTLYTFPDAASADALKP
jgi:predicted P-loop ATPase